MSVAAKSVDYGPCTACDTTGISCLTGDRCLCVYGRQVVVRDGAAYCGGCGAGPLRGGACPDACGHRAAHVDHVRAAVASLERALAGARGRGFRTGCLTEALAQARGALRDVMYGAAEVPDGATP